MTSKKMHQEKVMKNPSKNNSTRKSSIRVGGSSSVLPSPVGIRLWGCNIMSPSNEEKGKAKGEKPKQHQRAHEKEIIVKNENTKAISIENFKEQEIKLSQENVIKYKGVRQRKYGKWVAEIYDSRKKGCIWLGTFNTAEEAASVYNKAVIAIRGADAVTNILKPPPRDPSPTEINFINPPSNEINFMNLPSSSLNDA